VLCAANVTEHDLQISHFTPLKHRTGIAEFRLASVACGYYSTHFLRADGRVFATGNGISGQLGVGDTTLRSTFAQAVGLSHAIAVVDGFKHTVVLRSDGNVFTTGRNTEGQLADNSSSNKDTSRSTFVRVF
jgi:alpha-tubulin suppressor-like RCC1 family protein